MIDNVLRLTGKELKLRRAWENLSQMELAKKLGIRRERISRAENSDRPVRRDIESQYDELYMGERLFDILSRHGVGIKRLNTNVDPVKMMKTLGRFRDKLAEMNSKMVERYTLFGLFTLMDMYLSPEGELTEDGDFSLQGKKSKKDIAEDISKIALLFERNELKTFFKNAINASKSESNEYYRGFDAGYLACEESYEVIHRYFTESNE